MKNTELITVPTFTFEQGEMGETNWEYPIQVSYYNNGIELTQRGNQIVIDYQELGNLFKEIKRHLSDAQRNLKND